MQDFFTRHEIPIAAMITAEAHTYREELLQDMAYIQAKLDPRDIPPQA